MQAVPTIESDIAYFCTNKYLLHNFHHICNQNNVQIQDNHVIAVESLGLCRPDENCLYPQSCTIQ